VRGGRKATGLSELAGPPKIAIALWLFSQRHPLGVKGTCANSRASSPLDGDLFRPAGGGFQLWCGRLLRPSGFPFPRAGSATAAPLGAAPRHPEREGLGMSTLCMEHSSTIPLAGRPQRSGLIDGSDFLPYPRNGPRDHNIGVPAGLGRRPRTMVGAAQSEGASRLRMQYSPQSEEERGVKLTHCGHRYWVGRKGFEGFMPLSRWSEGAPRRRDRVESGVSVSRPAMDQGRVARSCARHCVMTTTAQ
jgi:hypothetical protein